MTPLANDHVTIAREGTLVKVPDGAAHDFDGTDTIVKKACSDEPQFRNEGAWTCLSHGIVHAHNLAASSHEAEGTHLIAWWCFRHHAIEEPTT